MPRDRYPSARRTGFDVLRHVTANKLPFSTIVVYGGIVHGVNTRLDVHWRWRQTGRQETKDFSYVKPTHSTDQSWRQDTLCRAQWQDQFAQDGPIASSLGSAHTSKTFGPYDRPNDRRPADESAASERGSFTAKATAPGARLREADDGPRYDSELGRGTGRVAGDG